MDLSQLCRDHARIALDSNVLMYLFEGTGPIAERAAEVSDAIAAGRVEACLATLGLAEILAGPAKAGASELVDRYIDELTTFEHLSLVPFDTDLARQAALLRGASSLSLADAIHVAAALRFGATAIVTNDRRIRDVPGLKVAYLDEMAASET